MDKTFDALTLESTIGQNKMNFKVESQLYRQTWAKQRYIRFSETYQDFLVFVSIFKSVNRAIYIVQPHDPIFSLISLPLGKLL